MNKIFNGIDLAGISPDQTTAAQRVNDAASFTLEALLGVQHHMQVAEDPPRKIEITRPYLDKLKSVANLEPNKDAITGQRILGGIPVYEVPLPPGVNIRFVSTDGKILAEG